ncbi:DUF1236 domain-containing protein [Phyllobacterium sp. 21LDTY02-6]|uniref:DUF1236 domain-containing protein n=1 Tax=Phyllobacterium sp. 21LDTY02-6 TaxID=2944903 RepID=UPI00201FCACB|nr:DUF1236 domain-containing protein [Phyllobacterium sp. 21LDTY02-6]MCO4319844.1 DUF1236 domain-containing protein [Phyllobacterium sp. 21LDTY02-6]
MKKALMLTAAALIATSGLAASGFAMAQDTVLVEVPQSARDYVIENPADPVVIEDDISQGYVVPDTVTLRPIPESPGYGYIYVDGHPVIVSMENRQVVYYTEGPNAGPEVPAPEIPASEIPAEVVTYIERHPTDPIVYEGELTTGTVIPADVPLVRVPDEPGYSYVYVDDRPALVENDSRRVVWVR